MYVYWGECVCFCLSTQKTATLLAFKMYFIKEEFKQKKKTLGTGDKVEYFAVSKAIKYNVPSKTHKSLLFKTLGHKAQTHRARVPSSKVRKSY